MESSSLQELEQIPGVGKTIARDMQNIGIHSIDALKGRQSNWLLVKYDWLLKIKLATEGTEKGNSKSQIENSKFKGLLKWENSNDKE